ncbi:MAG: hypothetical protein SGPRY_014302 [Prymnesium sp.]
MFRPSLLRGVEPARWAAHWCWELTVRLAQLHPLVEGLDFAVQPSDGKGMGLFALREVEEGAVVGFYSGRICSDQEYDAAIDEGFTSGDYGFSLGNGYVVDAEDASTSGPLRFCNHSNRQPNCQMGACKLFGLTCT